MFDNEMKSARLLIVDDQQANVTLLERILRSHGFVNLVSTTDPRQVADIYQQSPVDLVLLDLVVLEFLLFEIRGLDYGSTYQCGNNSKWSCRKYHMDYARTIT